MNFPHNTLKFRQPVDPEKNTVLVCFANALFQNKMIIVSSEASGVLKMKHADISRDSGSIYVVNETTVGKWIQYTVEKGE